MDYINNKKLIEKGKELVKENQWLMEKYNATQPIDGNLADAQTAWEFLQLLKEA